MASRKKELPEAERAFVDARKIRDYLLAIEHPVGRTKAQFFIGLGFKPDSWHELEAELKRLAREGQVELAGRNEYGVKYSVRGEIRTPRQAVATSVTVWIVLQGETAPRFITAYPEA